MLLSFNRWEKREEILSKIESGVNVIIQNYAFSGVTDLIANGEKLEMCLYCDQGLPRPDIVFQLDADIEKIKQRKMFTLTEEFNIKKKKAYKEFKDKLYWKTIDVRKSIDEISNLIILDLKNIVKQYKVDGIDEFKKNFYPITVGEDLFLDFNI